jgi:hypothetical protein
MLQMNVNDIYKFVKLHIYNANFIGIIFICSYAYYFNKNEMPNIIIYDII